MELTVLFLCTGNYYRSRYAEMRFNHLAGEAGLPLRAFSRGLRIDVMQKWNKGPLSADAVAACRTRKMRLPEGLRLPMRATELDLAAAGRIIALKDSEHRPMLRELHPAWCERIEYWDVTDVSPSDKYDPLAVIDEKVAALMDQLSIAAALTRASAAPATPAA
jgi:protein-tyrosine phosphatase